MTIDHRKELLNALRQQRLNKLKGLHFYTKVFFEKLKRWLRINNNMYNLPLVVKVIKRNHCLKHEVNLRSFISFR